MQIVAQPWLIRQGVIGVVIDRATVTGNAYAICIHGRSINRLALEPMAPKRASGKGGRGVHLEPGKGCPPPSGSTRNGHTDTK